MILASTISLSCSGPGSGCRGSNCGRHVNWREGKKDAWSLRQKYMEVPIEKVRPSLENAPLNQAVVQKYLSNMQQGKLVTTPKAFRKKGGIYELDDGHHRFAAAKKFGEKVIKLQVLT